MLFLQEYSFQLVEVSFIVPTTIIKNIMMSLCDNNRTKGLKLILQLGINFHYINDALFWASIQNYQKLVKLLLKYGADIHYDNDVVLVIAAGNTNIELVKLLLRNGANPIPAINSLKNVHIVRCVVDFIEIKKILRKYTKNRANASRRLECERSETSEAEAERS